MREPVSRPLGPRAADSRRCPHGGSLWREVTMVAAAAPSTISRSATARLLLPLAGSPPHPPRGYEKQLVVVRIVGSGGDRARHGSGAWLRPTVRRGQTATARSALGSWLSSTARGTGGVDGQA
jgi:hypothetical protein